MLIFKIPVLQALYSLSDEETEFQIKDRLSFQRFFELELDCTVPDATTVSFFRERLVVCTIGMARARIKIDMVNLAYTFQRFAWLEGRKASACRINRRLQSPLPLKSAVQTPKGRGSPSTCGPTRRHDAEIRRLFEAANSAFGNLAM